MQLPKPGLPNTDDHLEALPLTNEYAFTWGQERVNNLEWDSLQLGLVTALISGSGGIATLGFGLDFVRSGTNLLSDFFGTDDMMKQTHDMTMALSVFGMAGGIAGSYLIQRNGFRTGFAIGEIVGDIGSTTASGAAIVKVGGSLKGVRGPEQIEHFYDAMRTGHDASDVQNPASKEFDREWKNRPQATIDLKAGDSADSSPNGGGSEQQKDNAKPASAPIQNGLSMRGEAPEHDHGSFRGGGIINDGGHSDHSDPFGGTRYA